MNALVGWLGPSYALLKALHVSFVIFWMAGLFMLPRYLIYQAGVAVGSPEDLNWCIRTRRICRIILAPAVVAVWGSGLAVATSYGLSGALWLQLKISLVVVLTFYHGWMVVLARRMAAGERPVPERTLRFLNEVPGLFMLVIVFLAVLKPF